VLNLFTIPVRFPMDSNLFLVVALGFLVVMMFVSSRRRKKATETLQSSLKKGATIMLTSGIFAVIVEVMDDRVVVETAPGVKMTVVKAAVRSVEKPEVLAVAKSATKAAPKPATAAKPAAKAAPKTSQTAKKK
jgi:preprotein translocase subunit YajC